MGDNLNNTYNTYANAYAADNTNASKQFTCPICKMEFDDIHTFAAHLTEHSETAKKQKAEEERKARESERKKDIDNLEFLYAEKVSAERKLNKALDAYKEKYGRLVFPYKSITTALDDFINELFM